MSDETPTPEEPDATASDTPRTDAEAVPAIAVFGANYAVRSHFARQLERENAALRGALEVSLCRAYTAGYQHGYNDTVESQFSTIHHTDTKDYFADNVRQMMFDGSQPELSALLAATKGAEFP